ncbi:MAG TPA: DUF4097 family beta strand repeat-containing protein [Pyrinomonadaceae bacterium]|jgi:DUF4097 and DUF4098 domain-containing protein YvlB|nr:DUF4097 family beta strand repeat-containing protein [Pyrinomonadaceae bacterium]
MNQRKSQLLFVLLSIFLGLATGAAGQSGQEMRDEFHQTYPLAANGRVSLENINGAIRINGWDRNEVRVDAVKHGYTRERLDDAQIVVDAGSDAIHIRTRYSDENLEFNNDTDRRHNNPASVDYTLSLPRNARVESVEVVNGSIEIEGVTNDVIASSVNGPVRAHGLSGEARLSTVNGPVEVSFDRLGDKSISLSSVSGPLTLTIPSDANAQLKANSLSGRISNDYGLPVSDGDYVGHELSGVLGKGGPRIKLNNVSGSISIRRASDNRPLSSATSLLSNKMKDKEKNLADKEAEREARRAAMNSQREALREQIDTERITRETQAQVQRETQREAQRLARDTQREAQRAVRQAQIEIQSEGRDDEGNGSGNNNLRFVDRESKSFPVNGTPRVILGTFDGQIIVRSWDKQEVMYTALKRAGSEQQLQGISMRTQANGSEIQIKAEFDKAAARRIAPGITNINATVNLEVFVPRNTTLSASSGDGRLLLEGVNGELNLHTGDGSIDVRDSGGRLVAQTGDGRVRLTGFDGEADVNTGDGGITLEGRFTRLNARTGDGSISLAMPSGTNATIETNAEDVTNDGLAVNGEGDGESTRIRRWTVGSGGTLFKLHTGDGRITLRRTN